MRNDEKESISIRSLVAAPPSRCILALDYCQIELRCLAHLSGDSKLKDIFSSQNDVFCMLYSEWQGIPLEDVTSTHRQRAKQ